jgi:hypothetical protein
MAEGAPSRTADVNADARGWYMQSVAAVSSSASLRDTEAFSETYTTSLRDTEESRGSQRTAARSPSPSPATVGVSAEVGRDVAVLARVVKDALADRIGDPDKLDELIERIDTAASVDRRDVGVASAAITGPYTARERVLDANRDVALLRVRVEAVETKVDTATANITKTGAWAGVTDSHIAAVETKVDAASADIVRLGAWAGAADTRMTAVETAVGTADAKAAQAVTDCEGLRQWLTNFGTVTVPALKAEILAAAATAAATAANAVGGQQQVPPAPVETTIPPLPAATAATAATAVTPKTAAVPPLVLQSVTPPKTPAVSPLVLQAAAPAVAVPATGKAAAAPAVPVPGKAAAGKAAEAARIAALRTTAVKRAVEKRVRSFDAALKRATTALQAIVTAESALGNLQQAAKDANTKRVAAEQAASTATTTATTAELAKAQDEERAAVGALRAAEDLIATKNDEEQKQQAATASLAKAKQELAAL